MKLVRGWEKRYAPDSTGGLRLSKAGLYRAIGEEEGLETRNGNPDSPHRAAGTLCALDSCSGPVRTPSGLGVYRQLGPRVFPDGRCCRYAGPERG